MKIKTLILFLIIIVSFGFFSQSQIVSASNTSNGGLQARMEKVYLDHQSKKLLKDQVKSSDKGVDLHNSSINLARQQATVSLHDAIYQIINEFKYSNASCALTYNDAAALLIENKGFERYLSWISDFNKDFSYKIDSSQFNVACIRYLNCQSNTQKEGNILSVGEYQLCVNDISEKFTRYMKIFLDQNMLSTYNYGDEIFENGTLEDSNFDILYDIEQINKILFANAKRVPSYYLWGAPNYLSFAPTKLFASNSSLPSIQDAINQIQSNSAQESSITSNLQCFDPAPIIQSEDAKEFKAEIAKIQKTILSLEEEELIDDIIWTISQPFIADEAQQQVVIDNTLPPEIFEPEVTSETTNTDDSLEMRGDPDDAETVLDPNIPDDLNDAQCPSNPTEVSEQFDLQGDKPQIKECLSSCQSCSSSLTAKKACYSQCLCFKTANDKEIADGLGETTFGVKLCQVPSTTPDIITPGTQVLSIQEIINQIWALVGKLKESGQYIPSSKSSEFFSPTVKVGKLADILNFTMNISFKTKYRRQDKQVVAEDNINYFEKQTPSIPQLQIKHILIQQDQYKEFIKTHMDFWSGMNTNFETWNKAMLEFKSNQK